MQRVEDLSLEGLTRRIDGVSGNLSGTDSVSQSVDGDPARLHDRGMAVLVDRGPQGGEV